jgi:hypothetical protein
MTSPIQQVRAARQLIVFLGKAKGKFNVGHVLVQLAVFASLL